MQSVFEYHFKALLRSLLQIFKSSKLYLRARSFICLSHVPWFLVLSIEVFYPLRISI